MEMSLMGYLGVVFVDVMTLLLGGPDDRTIF